MKAFSGVHPLVLLLYFFSELTIVMFVQNPVLSVSAFLGAVLFCITLRKRGSVAADLGFYIPLFLLVAVTNPLFSHNGVTPLFFLNGNPVTMEAFVYGIAIAVVVIGVLLWSKGYSEIMTSDKFLYLFGRVIPKLSLVLSMALRFIPLFKKQMKKVKCAQKTMGLYSGKGIVDKFRSTGRIFLAMVSWSLENAMETASSMKARGYGKGKRTNFSLFRFTLRDGVLLTVSVVLMSVTVAGTAFGATTFRFYPRISRIDCSPFAITVYILFGILSLLPFIVEVKEAVIWNCCKSKI